LAGKRKGIQFGVVAGPARKGFGFSGCAKLAHKVAIGIQQAYRRHLNGREVFLASCLAQQRWQQGSLDNVYRTKGEREVSWFQENPAPSLERIARAGLSADASIIDIGDGASRLGDALVERNSGQITVLDLSAAASRCG
jgi:hypothetical protein